MLTTGYATLTKMIIVSLSLPAKLLVTQTVIARIFYVKIAERELFCSLCVEPIMNEPQICGLISPCCKTENGKRKIISS